MTMLTKSHYSQNTFIMESIEIILKPVVHYKIFELLIKTYENHMNIIWNLYQIQLKFVIKSDDNHIQTLN